MSVPIIRIDHLTKGFGKQLVIDDVSLEIKKGEIFGIIGLSGSGKTTLLKSMIGFLVPDQGLVRFRDERIIDIEIQAYLKLVLTNIDTVKKNFGFSAQSPSIYPKLTCMENLDYFGAMYNIPKRVRDANTKILLKLMGLTKARKTVAGNMSGGMQKRLDIACSLMHDPKILILDEPTSDLDPIIRKQMWKLIREINLKGTTVILSSHFITEIDHVCDRIGILYNGKVDIVGTPLEVKNLSKSCDEIFIETTPGKYEHLIKKFREHSKLKLEKLEIMDNKLVIGTMFAEKSLHEVMHVLEQEKEILIDVVINKPTLRSVLESLVEEGKLEETV